MRIVIEGASADFERKLLDLLAEHRHELSVNVDTGWTVERAELYVRTLTASARRFARRVVDAGGTLDSGTLRDELGKLNGPTNSLSRAVPRGVRESWWPEGTEAPITVVYGGPGTSSWRQSEAYTMREENVPVFREAFARLDGEPARFNWDDDAPSAFAPASGWGPDDDVPRALALDDNGEDSNANGAVRTADEAGQRGLRG
ncbi:hypothetical protein [Streptomyces sp. NPDC058297]|uniref:hypothetical protein n=1 Tax=Streptomyces sp. NPDC058297 TaxID=3346433 RepID=UPI0036EB9532